MIDYNTYTETYEACKQAEADQRKMMRDIALATINCYIEATNHFTTDKQYIKTAHATARGQIILTKVLDLITDEEKEILLQQSDNAYDKAIKNFNT